MDEIQDWFTNDSLAQFTFALVALRIVVEVTKGLFDKLWVWMTGYKPMTILYALTWAAFIVFLVKGGEWQANVINVFLLVVMSKVMDLE